MNVITWEGDEMNDQSAEELRVKRGGETRSEKGMIQKYAFCQKQAVEGSCRRRWGGSISAVPVEVINRWPFVSSDIKQNRWTQEKVKWEQRKGEQEMEGIPCIWQHLVNVVKPRITLPCQSLGLRSSSATWGSALLLTGILVAVTLLATPLASFPLTCQADTLVAFHILCTLTC